MLTFQQECSNIFSSGSGERLATQLSCPFLGDHTNSNTNIHLITSPGRVPIDPLLTAALDQGTPLAEAATPTTAIFDVLIEPLVHLPPREPAESE